MKRNQLLLILFVGVLMAALDIAIVGPALPKIREYFAVDDRAVAWLFTIYVLFNLIGTPMMAKLSDIYGRRLIYLTDVALFAAGSLIVALAPSFAIILLGRAIQGFGSGGIFPVASAVIGDTFPPEKRGSALGLIGAVFGLAFIVGPILGGILLLIGWRWLFAVNLPIAVLVMILAPSLLPSNPHPVRRPFDTAGMFLLAVMLAALTYGVNQIDTTRFFSSLVSISVGPFLGLAIVLLPLFLAVERRAVDPIIHLRLFGSRQLTLAYLISTGAGLGESAVVFIPILAIAALAVQASTASFLLMPLVLAMAVGAPTMGRLLDKLGSKVVVTAGASILATGMFILSLFSRNWSSFITASMLIGLGLSALLGAPIRYIMLNEARREDRAAAQAVITIFTSMGQLVSGALVGAVATSTGGGVAGYSTAYSIIGAVAVLMIFLTFGLKNRATELATTAKDSSVPAASRPG